MAHHSQFKRAGDTAMEDQEIVVYLDELKELCGEKGGTRWHGRTVTACSADGTAVKVLRRPDDPRPLRVVARGEGPHDEKTIGHFE